MSAELDGGFAAFPRLDPLIVGDVTGDGSVSGLDAHFVARIAVGLPQAEIPTLPAPMNSGSPPGDGPADAEVTLSLPNGLLTSPGATTQPLAAR